MIVTRKDVRELAAQADVKVSSDVFGELHQRAIGLVGAAIARAKENGRKTVFARDL